MCGSESGNNAIAPAFKALDHLGAWRPLQTRMAVFVETLTRNAPQVEKLFPCLSGLLPIMQCHRGIPAEILEASSENHGDP